MIFDFQFRSVFDPETKIMLTDDVEHCTRFSNPGSADNAADVFPGVFRYDAYNV